MATRQYKVTLTDETAIWLRAQDPGRGRLSEGIARAVTKLLDCRRDALAQESENELERQGLLRRISRLKAQLRNIPKQR